LAWVWITATAMADTPVGNREAFRQLDSEVQAIKEDILEINRELFLLEALTRDPHGEELVVLVSVADDSPAHPDRISVLLDGETVSRHVYTESERLALQEGGIHRIYSGGLDSGRHVLEISMTGKLSRGKDFQQQLRFPLTKKPGRTHMEVHLGPGRNAAKPEITMREWTP
jgi:hypothetical protein